jgi:hypothetical protein
VPVRGGDNTGEWATAKTHGAERSTCQANAGGLRAHVMICPTRPRCTASGLTMMKVRSRCFGAEARPRLAQGPANAATLNGRRAPARPKLASGVTMARRAGMAVSAALHACTTPFNSLRIPPRMSPTNRSTDIEATDEKTN